MAGAMTGMSVTPVVCRPRVSPPGQTPSEFPGGPGKLTA
jgi:hypothetical protein